MALLLPVPNWIGEDQAVLGAFDLLHKYLEGSVSDRTAIAAQLTAPVNNPPSDTTPRSIENYLWLLWDLFIDIARQVPNNHPWQGKLVELLAAIKHLPAPRHPERQSFERYWGFRLWNNLPILGADIRENWNQGPWEHGPDFHEIVKQYPRMAPLSVEVWVRLNTFAAKLTVASVLNLESYAIWLLRHALEVPRRIDTLDNNIPAAATWILHAGRIIYHNAARTDIEPRKPVDAKPQDFYQGLDGFPRERWAFWKERFRCERDNALLKESTRISATNAYNMMDLIESNEPEPVIDPNRPILPAAGQMRTLFVADRS